MMQPRLNPNAYGLIERDMCTPHPERASALISPYIPDQDYGDVNDVVKLDFSLTRQVAELYRDSKLAPPDLLLCTADSAVPIADAFRGLYDVADLGPTPSLGIVLANRKRSTDKYSSPRYNLFGPDAFLGRRLRAREIARLAPVIGYHTVIVEQSISSGTTASYAAKLALAAGAGRVSIIRGHWYRQAPRSSQIDRDGATSRHAPFMHLVGTRIATRLGW